MRPMNLEVEGFTCFTTKQQVDFTDLTLFAITGATGSGKSSLIDALIWALYGKVPRMGSQNMSELIAHGAGTMWARFTFEQSGETWRATRVLPRGRQIQAVLEKLVGEFPDDEAAWREEATGARAVKAAVESLLGLHYEAFIQAVVLPQGRFADFLHAKTTDRQKLLQRLLRLDIYTRMRARAKEHRQRLGFELQGLERRLDEDYEDVSEEALADLNEALAQLKLKQATDEEDLDKVQAQLIATKTLLEHWTNLDRWQAERERLNALSHEMETMRSRLKQARSIAPLLVQLEALARLADEVAEATQAARDAEVAETEARAAVAALPDAASLKASLAAAVARRQAIDAALPLLKPRDRLRGGLAETEQKLTALHASLGPAFTAPPADPARAELLDSLVSEAQRLKLLLERHHEEGVTLTTEREKLAAATARTEDARLEHTSAEAKAAALETALEQARAAQAELERAHLAAHLRAGLTAGDDCPVCLQAVVEPPAMTDGDPLEPLRAEVAAAETQASIAAAARDKARSALERAQQTLEDHTERVTAQEAALLALSQRARDLTADIAARAGTDAPSDSGALLSWLNSEQQAVEYARLDAERASLLVDLKPIEAQLKPFDGIDDLAAERQRAATQEDLLTRKRDEDAKTCEAAIDRLVRATSTRNAANTLLADKAQRHSRDDAELARDLAAAGYANPGAVTVLRLDDDEVRALEKTLADHDHESRTASTQWADAKAQIAEQPRVLAADVATLSEQLEDLLSRQNIWTTAIASRELQAAEMAKKLARVTGLNTELASTRASYNTYQELESELAPRCFPRVELDGSFQRLVEGASHRLKTLSADRYELAYSDGHFHVVDHDNGSELRRAHTLSGGETFYAALALALELSEQVQRTHGAIRLDSLFVDEGFGSLDEDTLDAAASVIEKLSQGLRMVGVITHVRAMSERLPARMLLERESGGSKLTVERT